MPRHFSILEVDDADAEFYAGELFKRVFGSEIPTFPRHFVCMYRSDAGSFRTAGYVHFSPFESMHLAGGQAVDKNLYGLIPPEHLEELPNRSIGEFVMGEGIKRLAGSVAVWAYIGDARSVVVNRNVGYVPTHLEKIFAFWKRDFPEEVKRAAAERVMRVAPF